MLARMRSHRASDKDGGFTLTELLITIVILGVLAGIVVFAVGAFNNEGVAAACKTDKKNVEVAVTAYYAKNSSYPTGADDAARILVLKTAGFLNDVPTSGDYTITLSTTGVVGSTGTCA